MNERLLLGSRYGNLDVWNWVVMPDTVFLNRA